MKYNFSVKLYRDISPGLGAVIGGGSSLLGDIFNLFGQSKANREQEQYNIGIMNQQRQWALQDVAAQNAYNSPVQQMQRLKEAGLNPNLVYGEGIQATGQSDQPRSVSAPSFTPGNTLESFSNLGNQAMNAVNIDNTLATGAKSRDQMSAEIGLTKSKDAFQKILNIEEGSHGRSDPDMKDIYQDLDVENASSEAEILNNQRQASKMLSSKVSQELKNMKDLNTREWLRNTREKALNDQTIKESVQRVANELKQETGIIQDNQNKAAEWQKIMSGTEVNTLDAMKKSGQIGDEQFENAKKIIVDALILRYLKTKP